MLGLKCALCKRFKPQREKDNNLYVCHQCTFGYKYKLCNYLDETDEPINDE